MHGGKFRETFLQGLGNRFHNVLLHSCQWRCWAVGAFGLGLGLGSICEDFEADFVVLELVVVRNR